MWRVAVRYWSAHSASWRQSGFAGVGEQALAVAAIVEGEHVHAGAVQLGQIVERVAEIAVLTVQIENGVAGPRGRLESTSPASWGAPVSVAANPTGSKARPMLAGVRATVAVGW